MRLVALVTVALCAFGAVTSAGTAQAAAPAFDTVVTLANTGTGTTAVAVADLDGDGRPDIVSSGLTSGVSVALGQGGRTFAPAADYVAPSPSGSPLITSVVIADISGDSTPDVVATNAGDNEVVVWRGNGDGTLAAPTELQLNAQPGCGQSSDNPCTAAFPAQVVVADFDRDARPDIVTANTNTDNLSYLAGTGGGAFAPAVQLGLGEGAAPMTIAAADLDRDGHLDVVAGGRSESLSVLLGDGSGGFAAPRIASTGLTQVAGVQLEDVTGDGLPDAVATDNGFEGRLAVLPGNASGELGVARRFDAGTNPIGVSVADLDGDRYPDLVVADNGADQALVLSGDGSGGFDSSAGYALGGGSAPQPVVVADVDGDTRPDIVTGNRGSAGRDVSILYNSSPRRSQIALRADSDHSAAGDRVTYTATVAAATGTGSPTGTVDFTDAGTDVAGCVARPIDAGRATCTVTYETAGSHAVTAAYSGDTSFATAASLAVSHEVGPAAPDHLVVAPASATIAAGGKQSFTAESYDRFGNDIGDATSSASFSLSPAPDGATCTGADCTATAAGTYTVNALAGSVTGAASLTVTTAPVASLAVSLATNSTTAGTGVDVNATGTDAYGNSTGDETGAATFTITPMTGGATDGASCAAARCSATIAGTYRIDASVPTASGTATGSAQLTVTAGTLASLTVSPDAATVTAGAVQSYTATGSDTYGNSLGDLTAETIFTIDGDGSCTAASCSAREDGRYTITARDGSVSGNAILTVVTPARPAPTLTSVDPAVGSTAGGTSVTIGGSGFADVTAVSFGDAAAASFTIVSDSQLRAVSPAHAASTVDVVVTGPGGASTTSDADRFTFASPPPPPPTVTALSPARGTSEGGNVVTVSGARFDASSAVSFGTVASTRVTVLSSTKLQAISPALAIGTYDVRVTAAGGTSAVTKGDLWTAVAPKPAVSALAPSSGTTAGSTTVTVTGKGFTKAGSVKFGTTGARSFTVVSDGEIRAVSPAHAAGPVTVTVSTVGGTSIGGVAATYSYVTPPPSVTSVSPRSGPVDGGTTVTISGRNLTSATEVDFGAVAATSVTVASSTTITAVAPARPAGTVDITVVTPAGSSNITSASTYRYVAPRPVVTSVSPAAGPKTGGTSVTILGSGFTGITAVKFGSTVVSAPNVVSDTRLVITTPAHGVGGVSVTIAGPGGTNASSSAARYTYR